jgi:hypothetical protein
MEPTVLVALMVVSLILLCLGVSALALLMQPYRKPTVTEPVRKSYPLADDWFVIAESTGVGRDRRRPKHKA